MGTAIVASSSHSRTCVSSFLTPWTRRERFENALDEEVRFHVDACTEDLGRSGIPKREALRRARAYFSVESGRDPVGRRFRQGAEEMEIVGVVADSRDHAIRSGPADTVYMPEKQGPTADMTLLVRAADDPERIVPALRALAGSIDPRMPVISVHTLDVDVEAGMSRERIPRISVDVACARVLEGMLFGVAATDPLTLAASVAVLAAAAVRPPRLRCGARRGWTPWSHCGRSDRICVSTAMERFAAVRRGWKRVTCLTPVAARAFACGCAASGSASRPAAGAGGGGSMVRWPG